MSQPARGVAALDWLLIAIGVPLYLVTLSLQIRGGTTTGLSLAGVETSSAPTAEGFPRVEVVYPDARFVGDRLELGDQILAMNGRSLAGASQFAFQRLAIVAVRSEGGAQLVVEHGNTRLEPILLGQPNPRWWSSIFPVGAILLAALIILLRAPGWPMARLNFVGSLALGISPAVRVLADIPLELGPLGSYTVPTRLVHLGTYVLALSMPIAVVWGFTASAEPRRAWMRALPWLVAIGLVATLVTYNWLPQPLWGVAWPAFWIISASAMILLIVGLTRCYVRADSLERRQLRWVLYGVYVAVIGLAGALLSQLAGYSPATAFPIANAATAAYPIGLLIALFGYRLFDVDRLISATTSLTILGVALHEAIVHVIPDVAKDVSHRLGVSVTAGKWVLSLVFAVFLIRAHGRLRPWIDRRLFPLRVSVEEGLAQLVVDLAGCRDAQELTERSATRLAELLKPESLVVYAHNGAAFTPVFSRGQAVPPAIAPDGPLVRVLESRKRPLSATNKEIDPFDRAVLATLGAEVLTPTRRGESLVAFTCLGRKRSRDIYTPAEIALLAAVATASSEVLKRLGDQEVLVQAQLIQASLRRYVPGAVAEQLESGRDIEDGEREVTALFVDLRALTSDSMERRAEDVFSSVNEHTERVSAIVRKHGGAMVELSGDGIMAVFGAPKTLPDKERRAIEAAREIVDSSPRGLPVGVGIATGRAYAGNLRAADRWVWTVVGETPNLASRLQSVTRELGSSIAADDATRRGAGYVCADFALHRAVSVPGRNERIDVFALPLAHAVSRSA